jgi:hypothetical protein
MRTSHCAPQGDSVATLYRAIWSDAEPELVETARELFGSWVRDKSDNQLAAGEAGDEQTEDGTFRFQLREAHTGEPEAPVTRALRASFTEVRDNGSRWTTTLQAWTDTASENRRCWMWIDVEAVTYDSLDGVVVAAPRFVPDLLERGIEPNRHGTPVSAVPLDYAGKDGAEDLAELLTYVDRDLPVVVFAAPPPWFEPPPSRSAEELHRQAMLVAARMSAGMALVCHLDTEGVKALGEALGELYTVRDGAFRIYLPGLDPATEDAWRHRYTVLAQFAKRPNTAGKLINRAIGLHATARRAPASYELASKLLDSAARDSDELMQLLGIADEEASQMRERIASLDQKYLDSLEDQHLLEQENNKLRDELHVARRKLALVEQQLWQDRPDEMTQLEALRLPSTADSPSDAANLAQTRLNDFLSFPAEACVDLEDIDNCVEARAWGDSSWRAFRALHAYAKEMADGDEVGTFWTWCQHGHSLAWPATPKKLAMVESDSVKNSDKLSGKRIFPVDRRISSDGKVFMEAHIKIAEGGGSLAPRIYFLSSQETGKVHIGYFGPHRNVPNTLS